MVSTAGTGAGVGIAVGLLILFIAGPGAYYYRKRRRRQLEDAENARPRDADVDYFGGVKPQLDDTAIDPEKAWRISSSTVDDGPTAMTELAEAQHTPARTRVRGIDLRHPTVLRPGPKPPATQELDVSNDNQRPELRAGIATPPPAELRTEKSPPVEPQRKDIGSQDALPVESHEEFARSDDSMQLPALPGPLLPPKRL